MKAIALVFLLSVLSVTYSLKFLAQRVPTVGNLHFYHEYEKNHKQILPNVPVAQHYVNERQNREKAANLEHDIQKLKRDSGFKNRDLSREKLALENEKNKSESVWHAQDKIYKQRIRSIQEEINHDEKYKEIYQRREDKNQNSLKTALPDQKTAFQDIVNFDRQWVTHWNETEDNYQKKLIDNVHKEQAGRQELSEALNTLDAEVLKLDGHMKNLEAQTSFRESRLQEKENQVNDLVKQDVALDKQRRTNQLKEHNSTNVSQTKETSKENTKEAQTKTETNEKTKMIKDVQTKTFINFLVNDAQTKDEKEVNKFFAENLNENQNNLN